MPVSLQRPSSHWSCLPSFYTLEPSGLAIQPADLGPILKVTGFSGYNPDQHDAMEQAIVDHVAVGQN